MPICRRQRSKSASMAPLTTPSPALQNGTVRPPVTLLISREAGPAAAPTPTPAPAPRLPVSKKPLMTAAAPTSSFRSPAGTPHRPPAPRQPPAHPSPTPHHPPARTPHQRPPPSPPPPGRQRPPSRRQEHHMMLPACPIRRSGQPSPQHGMTLIELMVAMALGLLIVLAAAASLLFAREGFTAVDAASQLRDNGRFLQNLVLRLGAQTGYKNLRFATETKRLGDAPGNALAPPDIFGVNNAKRGTQSEWDSGTERQSGELGYFTHILVLHDQTSSATADSATSDKTMIDCAGVAATNVPTEPGDKLVSILYVKEDSAGAEPALMCARSETGAAPYDAQPIISGVENFQVLYGVDGIGPANTAVPGTTDRVVDRYLRADQLTVSGSQPASINKAATYANWRRVRSIRIGVVLRGPPGSAKPDGGNQTFYPLGITKDSASGTEGAAFSSSNDPGSIYTPPFDGRLRQTLTFTVHLRNAQDEN